MCILAGSFISVTPQFRCGGRFLRIAAEGEIAVKALQPCVTHPSEQVCSVCQLRSTELVLEGDIAV